MPTEPKLEYKITVNHPVGEHAHHGRHNRSVTIKIEPVESFKLVWYVAPGTPDWAVSAAEHMGYQIERA